MLKKAKVLHYHNSISRTSIKEIAKKVVSQKVQNMSKETSDAELFCTYLPVGTIIAQSLVPEESVILCLPLLSSHISLPVKQGEYIWYFTDEYEVEESVTNNNPLFKISNYWVSRLHGSLISEDVNYTFKERDANFKQSYPDEYFDPDYLYSYLPSFKTKDVIEHNVADSQKKSTESLYLEGTNNYFFPKAAPRYFSESDDLSLQGSYNTLINFTKTNDFLSTPSGSIEIIAGRRALQDFTPYEEEDVITFSKVIVDNKETNVLGSDDEVVEEITLNKKKYEKVLNNLGFEEIFKCPEVYLNSPISVDMFNQLESQSIISENASQLIINESINVDTEFYYDTSFLESVLEFPGEIDIDLETDVSKKYLRTPVKISNSLADEKLVADSIDQDGNIVSMPSIFLKSNNIRIIARDELNNEEKHMPSGSIRLVKEGKENLSYSHVLMQDDGNIDMLGKSIRLGSFKVEMSKSTGQSIDEIDENNINAESDEVLNMHGNGKGLLIGHVPSMSEPLVLGNTLHSMLETILNINIDAFKLIASQLSDLQAQIQDIEANYATHVHAGVGGPSNTVSRSAFPTSPINVADISDQGKLIKEIQDLNSNLTHMLSRFAKTT